MPLPRVQLSLQRSGDQTLLHIRTLQPVNDPVAQFVLISDCETRLHREYTVLLDPPALVTPALSPEASASAAPTVAAPVAAPAPRASRPNRRINRPAVASVTPVANSRKPTAPDARVAPADATPRLVLSGKRNTDGAPFALRLDTNLPDLTRPRPERLTA